MTVVMLASTLLTAAPAMALTAPTVTVSGTTISGRGAYTITFTAGANLSSGGNRYILVTFPAGTDLSTLGTWTGDPAFGSSVSLQVLAGINGGTHGGDNAAHGVAFNATPSGAAVPTLNITLNATSTIGAGSLVGIVVGNATSNVTNPSAAGNYTLTVETKSGSTVIEAAQTSNSYTISNPSVAALPGVASVYNPNGILMAQSNSINTALTSVNGSNGWLITLTAGTYAENPNTNNISSSTFTGITVGNDTVIRAADGVAANTVNISGTFTLNSTTTTLKNVLITGKLVVGEGANTTIVDSVTVTKSSSTTSAGNLMLANSTVPNQVLSFVNLTLDTTRGTVVEYAANVSVATTTGVSFTGCTFKGDQYDTLLAINGGNSSAPLLVRNCTFQGASATDLPQGIVTGGPGGFNSITNNTLTNLNTAFIANAASNTTATLNTITGSGNATAQNLATEGAVVSNGGTLILINNTISNSAAANYALNVLGGNVTARFNSITGNTLNINQAGTGVANATVNWWGSSSGPAASSFNSTDSTKLVYTPYLTGVVTNSALGLETDRLDARSTAGVDITSGNTTQALATVGAAKYAANPQSVAPLGSPVGYYDVYLGNVAAGNAVTIKFYGSVTDNTKVYFGGGLAGSWTLASNQGVNTASGFAYVVVTSISSPDLTGMGGTPFVLTNIAPTPAAPALTAPAAGAINVPVNTAFGWTPVTGATYTFQLSTSPTFAGTLTANVSGLTNNVYGLATNLTASTSYYWRVSATAGGVTSSYAVGTFTTAAPAAPAAAAVAPNITVTAPVVNIAAPPAPNVNIAAPPPAVVNISPPAVTVQAPPPAQVTVNVPPVTQAIPNSILYVIILIGAVLIIALIVLVVRTRRVA